MCKLTKVTGYQVLYKNQEVFTYICIEQMDIKILKTVSYIITLKTSKYLNMNLTKFVKDLCGENFRNVNKRNQRKPLKWRDLSCSLIGRLSIVSMTILPD